MRVLSAFVVLTGCTAAPALEAADLAPAPVLEGMPAPTLENVAPTPVYAPAPSFRFQALGDSSATFALEDFAGRFVLVDFWASWCSPCLEEIPRIAAVLEDHSDRLAVLSVSLDHFEDDVEDFRGRFHPMPWNHAFADGRFEDEGVTLFGVDRLPFAFLIGPDGTLRAQGGELRRDLLRITIERALAAKP